MSIKIKTNLKYISLINVIETNVKINKTMFEKFKFKIIS